MVTCPFIYGLFDPELSDQIRYVGMAFSRGRRPLDHLRIALKPYSKVTPVISWIRSLLEKGIDYDVRILEELPSDSSRDHVYNVEKLYILSLRQEGHRLTNLNDGGPGATPGEAGRERLSRRMMGNTLSLNRAWTPQSREKLSTSLQQYYLNHPDARERISKQFIGNTHAAGRVFSADALKAIGAAHVGKQHALGAIHSDEANKAKSVGLLAYNADPFTADDRARQHTKQGISLSATIEKKKIDDPDGIAEANARRSASLKESWARRREAKSLS